MIRTIHDHIQTKITEFFVHELNHEIPSPRTDLLERGIVDSLTLVELTVFLEKEFGVDFSQQEIEVEDFRSIETIAAFALHAPKNPTSQIGTFEFCTMGAKLGLPAKVNQEFSYLETTV